MLDKLIKDGKWLIDNGNLDDEDYEKWCSACIAFLELNYNKSALINRFITITGTKGISECRTALGLLEGLKEVSDENQKRIKENATAIAALNRTTAPRRRNNF